MAKTILDLANDVCDRVTVRAPSTLFGTNDTIARILRQAAYDTLRDLLRGAGRNGLQGFNAQWIFATRPGIYAYRMPPDFLKMIPGTEQRGRWPFGLLGPVTPQTWANWIAGTAYTAVPMGWRIKNNLMHIEPPPAKAEIVVIEYVSRYPVARDATDDDLAPVDGYLQPVSPLIPREGHLSPDAYDTVDLSIESEWGSAVWGTAVWGQTPAAAMRRIQANAAETQFPRYQVRAPEFAADTDKSALDDDHVLSLGMVWRLLKAQGRPYAEARDEYESEREVFLSNDGSRGRTIVFGGASACNEVEPLGDGRWMIG